MNVAVACGLDEKALKPALQLLSDAGLEAAVEREPRTGDAASVYVVSVPVDDQGRSIEVLSTWSDGGGAALILCPSCGSVTVQFPANPARSPSSAALGSVVSKVAQQIGADPAPFLCLKCQYSWS